MNFRKVNAFLDDYMVQTSALEEYSPLSYEEKMKKLYEIACYIYREGCSHFDGIDTILVPQKKIKKEETLALVLSYFETVDTSFVSGLYFALQEDIHFLFYEEMESQNLFSFGAAGIQQQRKYIQILLDETITDAFTLVHEFSHYQNMPLKEQFSVCYQFFTEGYAHMFETDFYFFLLKNKKYREEAILYYERLLLSFLNRSCTFIGEYSILDTYLQYTKISNQTIYRTFKNSENPLNGYKMEMESLSTLLEKMDNPHAYFLEDGPYMLALPFAKKARKFYQQNRDTFLQEYSALQERRIEDYYKKYVKSTSLKNSYFHKK